MCDMIGDYNRKNFNSQQIASPAHSVKEQRNNLKGKIRLTQYYRYSSNIPELHLRPSPGPSSQLQTALQHWADGPTLS
jgi:hypothetical protein